MKNNYIHVRATENSKDRLKLISDTLKISQADVIEKLLYEAAYSIEMTKQTKYKHTQREAIDFLRSAFNTTTTELEKIFNMELPI